MHGGAVHSGRRRALYLGGEKSERWHPALAIPTVQNPLRGTQVAQLCDDFAAVNPREGFLPARHLQDFSLVTMRDASALLSLRRQKTRQLFAIGLVGFRVLPPVKEGAQSLDPGHTSEKRGQTRRAVLMALLMDAPALFEVAVPQGHTGIPVLPRQARCFALLPCVQRLTLA